ncbi:hypothetical protein N505_0123930 [Rhodococcus aetherivorans]|nr:hypothetical protein N505_0123930 [Rhodococcus aetherivorans]
MVMSHWTSLAAAIARNSCAYVRNPFRPASPMVIRRCTGVARRSRPAVWARATARSTDAAVASRCAAARNASASWGLSVDSA